MSDRPFQCPRCNNWHTPIVLEADNVCWMCVDGTHARNVKTNDYDCHHGLMSSTSSEIRMSGILQALQSAKTTIQGSDLGVAEMAFAAAERAERELPNVLEWAGVFEMPGETASTTNVRFKSIDALAELVLNNRRPQSDLDEMRRSVKICNEMAAEVPPLMAEIRTAIGQARHAVTEPVMGTVTHAVGEGGPSETTSASTEFTEAPLYVSDKPPAPPKARKTKRKKQLQTVAP